MDYYIICHLAENPSKLFIYPGEHAVVAVAAAAQLSAYFFVNNFRIVGLRFFIILICQNDGCKCC